ITLNAAPQLLAAMRLNRTIAVGARVRRGRREHAFRRKKTWGVRSGAQPPRLQRRRLCIFSAGAPNARPYRFIS
ncbi:MAG: hypothetical protein K2I54_07315, partial [Muribaculaceae bacterium]|nr:hypothetical protein [Muribaculaceae bacterium]